MKVMLDVESKYLDRTCIVVFPSFLIFDFWVGSYAEATTGTCPSGQRFAFMNPFSLEFS